MMYEKHVAEHSFKKKYEAMTLAAKTAVKLQGKVVQVDPQLLFQRLVTAGPKCRELSTLLKYELSSYPPV